MASVIGVVIDIPIIIRSLSRDFYLSAVRNDYSIPLDRDFLLALDGGIISTAAGGAPAAEPLIDTFFCTWWTDDLIRANPILQEHDVLNMKNIDDCLIFHRQQSNSLATPDTVNGSIAPGRPRYIWNSNSVKPISDNDPCIRCRLYRAVAMGTLEDHRHIRNHVQAMEVSFSTQRKEAIRRASGFNQLYEYLLIKEDVGDAPENVGNIPIDSPYLSEHEALPGFKSKNAKKRKKITGRRAVAASVRQTAIAEVKRVGNMPSLKWTWGADMDESDLPAFHRSVDMGKKLPHSGYDTSLIDGTDTRTASTIARDLRDLEESGYFSDVCEDARRPVPELDGKDIPSCLYSRIRKKPSRYLSSLRDEPDHPMDGIRPAGTAAAFVVPPPPVLNTFISNIDDSMYYPFHFVFCVLTLFREVTERNPILPSYTVPTFNALVSLMSHDNGGLLFFIAFLFLPELRMQIQS